MFYILEAAINKENIGNNLIFLAHFLEEKILSAKEEKEKQKIDIKENLKEEIEQIILSEILSEKENKKETLEEPLEEFKEESLEEELEDDLDEDLPTIQYSFDEEQFLMEQFYNTDQINYEHSWYKETKSSLFESEEEYLTPGDEFSDTEAEILTTEEAEETLIEIQYAAVSGTPNDINSEKKRKFDIWIKFNPALFKLFESSYALTRNVDYRPLA